MAQGVLVPYAVVRDNSSNPSLGRQVHDFIVCVDGGGTQALVIETKLHSILMVVAENETDGTLLVPTIGDSSLYSGTKTVTVTLANNKTYKIRVTGIVGTRVAITNYTPGNAAGLVTYEPLKG